MVSLDCNYGAKNRMIVERQCAVLTLLKQQHADDLVTPRSNTMHMRSFFAQQHRLGVLNYIYVIDCLNFMKT